MPPTVAYWRKLLDTNLTGFCLFPGQAFGQTQGLHYMLAVPDDMGGHGVRPYGFRLSLGMTGGEVAPCGRPGEYPRGTRLYKSVLSQLSSQILTTHTPPSILRVLSGD